MEKYLSFAVISCFVLIFAPYPIASYSKSNLSKETLNESDTEFAISLVTGLLSQMFTPTNDSIVDSDTGFNMTFPQGWNGTGTDMFFMESATVSPTGVNMSNIMTQIITEMSKQNTTEGYPGMTEEQMQPIYQQMASEMINDMVSSNPVILTVTMLDREFFSMAMTDPTVSPKPTSLSEFFYSTNDIANCNFPSVNHTRLNGIPAENSVFECVFGFDGKKTRSIAYGMATNDKIIFMDYSATLDQFDKYYDDAIGSFKTVGLKNPIDPSTMLK